MTTGAAILLCAENLLSPDPGCARSALKIISPRLQPGVEASSEKSPGSGRQTGVLSPATRVLLENTRLPPAEAGG